MTALLFDLYGVIMRVQSPRHRRAVEQAAGADPELFWDAYWVERPDYDAGLIHGPEYYRRVGQRVGTPLRDPNAVLQADLAGWAFPDESMVELAGRLHAKGVRLGLLSNIFPELIDWICHSQQWLELFDPIVFSGRELLAKPDPRIYRLAQRRFGLPADQILFIDDRADNVAAALEVGFQGQLFTGQAELEAALHDLSILV